MSLNQAALTVFKTTNDSVVDKTLFNQHDVQWVPPGYPGEGNLLVFNNGLRRPDGSTYSSADEIVPPILPDGTYDITTGSAYGPAAPVWTHTGWTRVRCSAAFARWAGPPRAPSSSGARRSTAAIGSA